MVYYDKNYVFNTKNMFSRVVSLRCIDKQSTKNKMNTLMNIRNIVYVSKYAYLFNFNTILAQ